jgi:hypothetical protein
MQAPDDLPQCTLEEFFLNMPPGRVWAIKPESLKWNKVKRGGGPSGPGIPMPVDTLDRNPSPLPELKLNCSSEKCGGSFWFEPVDKYRSEALIELGIGKTREQRVRQTL